MITVIKKLPNGVTFCFEEVTGVENVESAMDLVKRAAESTNYTTEGFGAAQEGNGPIHAGIIFSEPDPNKLNSLVAETSQWISNSLKSAVCSE